MNAVKQTAAVTTARITSATYGIGVGAIAISVLGVAYLALLREPGSLFYLFAGLIFVGAPLMGATAAVRKSDANTSKIRVFLRACTGVFGLAVLAFILTYAVYPQFQRTTVQLPAFCGGFAASGPPPGFDYEIPGIGAGILLAGDSQAALAAAVDWTNPPFHSTVYLVRKSGRQILWSSRFENDIIAASIDGGTLYLYNDKLGFWIDAANGRPKRELFTIDNYGGLSQTDRPVLISSAPTGRWYMETTAMISSWNIDGSVATRRRVAFNSIAFNCLVTGATGAVTQLWSR